MKNEMTFKYPMLVKGFKSHRNRRLWVKPIIYILIGFAFALVASTAVKADDSVVVGIAPGESEVKILNIVDNPYQTIQISESEFEELRWVLALEAQGEGLEGEIACCEAIFNRVLSPNNWGIGVHGVLSKKGQFSTYKYIGSKKAWAKPGEMEDDAISECLRSGCRILPSMKYVYFDSKGGVNGRKKVKIGHHTFGAEK